MTDDMVNFAATTIETAPSPATSGTDFYLTSGPPSPTAPYDLTVWPSGQPLYNTAEIIRVTAQTGNHITACSRGQYGTSPIAISAGYLCEQGVTANLLSQLGRGSVQWVDLGLIDLVSAIMDGPTTLYNMPTGSFLSSIRFTDDPATVQPDLSGPWSNTSGSGAYLWPAFGTVKSFGWGGFASMNNTGGVTAPIVSDSTYLASIGAGYGPFAALDAGNLQDLRSLVLSAAVVGPIQCALMCAPFDFASGTGQGVRVAAITPWVAATHYDSPASNTFATPGVLQRCAILENGTIWVNDGTSGTSGGSAPDFVGNAGGSVADGPNIVWYDTTSPPPTVGAVHAFAEIIYPVSP